MAYFDVGPIKIPMKGYSSHTLTVQERLVPTNPAFLLKSLPLSKAVSKAIACRLVTCYTRVEQLYVEVSIDEDSTLVLA